MAVVLVPKMGIAPEQLLAVLVRQPGAGWAYDAQTGFGLAGKDGAYMKRVGCNEQELCFYYQARGEKQEEYWALHGGFVGMVLTYFGDLIAQALVEDVRDRSVMGWVSF